MCARWKVSGMIGRGVFSSVLKATDEQNPEATAAGHFVAVKMIRNNDFMHKCALLEVKLLLEIAEADPEGKKHCIVMLQHLEHRSHFALFFEPMRMNLREALHKFGKGVGLNIDAVRLYARQLFIALHHIAKLGIVHADIKPDNILVNDSFNVVKLCDFGSAFKEADSGNGNDPTPYLVSRYYRAPEVILGLKFNRQMDVWSSACCLYEVFTGSFAFTGISNSGMLAAHQATKGQFPRRMLREHLAVYVNLPMYDPHFEAGTFRFRHLEPDAVNKDEMRLKVSQSVSQSVSEGCVHRAGVT